MPLRVLYVSASGCLGGAERSLLELIRALDRTRVQPLAAVPPAGPLAEDLRSAHAEVVAIPALRFRRTMNPVQLAQTSCQWAAAVLTLIRALRRRQVDLVHANNTAAHLIAAPAAAIAHLPCLWHVRDLHRLPLLQHLLAPFTQGVICVSRAVAQRVWLPRSSRLTVRVIPNGIDAEAWRRSARPGAVRRELHVSPDAPVVLMAAHMVPWKGHETFIRAVAQVRKEWPHVAAPIAGADLFGEHALYEGRLRQLTQELGLQSNVHFLDHRADVASLMADCDLLVIPSEEEPFGRVALEAMAVGRAVVGTSAGGLKEVVQDGVTGLLVPPRDVAALSAGMRRLLSDAPLRRQMGEAGRARVQELFLMARHVEAVSELYGQITAAFRSGSPSRKCRTWT